MTKEREEITIYDSEFWVIVQGDHDNLIREETETEYINFEKGYQTVTDIFRRKSDGKYFRITYNEGPGFVPEELNEFPIVAKEVFQKEVRTIIYE